MSYSLNDYLQDNEDEYPPNSDQDEGWFKPFPDEVEDKFDDEKSELDANS